MQLPIKNITQNTDYNTIVLTAADRRAYTTAEKHRTKTQQ